MKVEWGTICEQIDAAQTPRIDLLAANSAGVYLVGQTVPADVAVTLALCIVGTREEAAVGGILNVAVIVLRPDGTVAGGTNLIWAFEEGRRPEFPEPPVRQIVPLHFAFVADVEGPYGVVIRVEGEDALMLPYAVVCVPDGT